MNAQTWTDETLIGAGAAMVREGAFGGQTGRIEAYAFGTVMLMLTGHDVALPFGLGEISEIRETKGDAIRLGETQRMARSLKFLSDWAEANGTAGRTISAEPDAGPGTMVWRAR